MEKALKKFLKTGCKIQIFLDDDSCIEPTRYNSEIYNDCIEYNTIDEDYIIIPYTQIKSVEIDARIPA